MTLVAHEDEGIAAHCLECELHKLGRMENVTNQIKNGKLSTLIPLVGAGLLGFYLLRRFVMGGSLSAIASAVGVDDRKVGQHFRGGKADVVDEASMESFPASDSPATW